MSVTSPAPQWLKRSSTADETVALLRTRIVSGELAPGTQLREVALSQAIGVSRPTLREALQALKHEGLVQHEAHRGVFVATLGPAEIVDIYQVRHVLECSAARGCANATPDALEAVRSAWERLAPAWAAGERAAIEADLAFHQRIVALLGSRRLDALFDTVTTALRPCLGVLSREARAQVLHAGSLAEHDAILAPLLARRPRAAERLLAAHIEANQALLLQVVQAGSS
ncbi:MAG: GntR family transcriptional regulator [Solirubrobacteraceae bacterium]